MPITIYHNPRCSKSRQTLTLLEDKNITPIIIEYLSQTPSINDLKVIFVQLGFTSVRDMMRTNENVYKELNLSQESITDEQLFEAMHNNPILIERPIVVNNSQAKIGRPPEQILDIL